MRPVFKLNNSDKFYVDEKYVSNGHWLVVKDQMHKGPKALLKLKNLQDGTHYLDGHWDAYAPNITSVIPKRDGYELLSPFPMKATLVPKSIVIESYSYTKANSNVLDLVSVQPQYSYILQMGRAFSKGSSDPILVLDDNDDLVAVVMPMRP